jgi:divalent metal cation (Fe/Co/Zn/Cd) transporter
MPAVPLPHDLQRALRWSAATVVWTLTSSAIAIAAGLASGSLLLVVFGAVGAVDLLGSVVLVSQLRHTLHHERVSPERERQALLVIALAMGTIAAVTAVVSVLHLVHRSTPGSSAVGYVVAGCSVVVLPVLSWGKRRLARLLDNRALLADAQLSAMGGALALFTLAGTAASTALGWWWLDPVGSLLLALVGTVAAVGHVRAPAPAELTAPSCGR